MPTNDVRSRYFENGSPTKCFLCGQPFEGRAIHDGESNRYLCSDECLESIRFFRLALLRKAS
jgi:hypothetical protein